MIMGIKCSTYKVTKSQTFSDSDLFFHNLEFCVSFIIFIVQTNIFGNNHLCCRNSALCTIKILELKTKCYLLAIRKIKQGFQKCTWEKFEIWSKSPTSVSFIHLIFLEKSLSVHKSVYVSHLIQCQKRSLKQRILPDKIVRHTSRVTKQSVTLWYWFMRS